MQQQTIYTSAYLWVYEYYHRVICLENPRSSHHVVQSSNHHIDATVYDEIKRISLEFPRVFESKHLRGTVNVTVNFFFCKLAEFYTVLQNAVYSSSADDIIAAAMLKITQS